jgi:hypothetical protein
MSALAWHDETGVHRLRSEGARLALASVWTHAGVWFWLVWSDGKQAKSCGGPKAVESFEAAKTKAENRAREICALEVSP